MIVRNPVTSSQLKAIGYDEASKIMHIEFPATGNAPAGSVYAYFKDPEATDVPETIVGDVYTGLMAENEAAKTDSSRSVGKYFGVNVKKNKAILFKKLGTPAELDAQEGGN